MKNLVYSIIRKTNLSGTPELLSMQGKKPGESS